MDDLRFYLIVSGVAVIALLLVVGLSFFKKLKPKIVKILKKVLGAFIFNGLLNSLNIMFIQLCISFGKQIQLYYYGYTTELTGSLVCFVLMLGYPISTTCLLYYLRRRLNEPKISDRISNLYQDVFVDEMRCLVYFPIFLLRRILFVAIPTFLIFFPYHQI